MALGDHAQSSDVTRSASAERHGYVSTLSRHIICIDRRGSDCASRLLSSAATLTAFSGATRQRATSVVWLVDKHGLVLWSVQFNVIYWAPGLLLGAGQHRARLHRR